MLGPTHSTKQVRIVNRSRPLGRPLFAGYCDHFWCRLRGLAWRRAFHPERGLVLAHARAGRGQSSIHMLGMFFDLAIVWLDEEKRVVDVRAAYRWRSLLWPAAAARYVIECALERIPEFQIGDQVDFENAPSD